MATAYSSAKKHWDPLQSQIYFRVRMVYSITSNTDTSSTIGVTYTTMQRSTDGGSTFSDYSGQASSQTITIGGTQTTSKKITKTHNDQPISITGSWTYHSLSFSISTSITVLAKTKYKVTFNANGGSNAPSQQDKWHDETLTLTTSKPLRTGYTFQGWAKTSTGAVAYNAGGSFGLNANTTLYAVWKIDTYTVKYYLRDSNAANCPPSQTKTYGTNLTLSSTTPTLQYYTFKGWATSTANANAGTVNYARSATYTGNAALNLYAVWERTYSKPTITNVKAIRCLQNGTADDEGTYAKITFNWSVFRTSGPRYYGGSTYPYSSNKVSNCTVTINSQSTAPTLSDANAASGTASAVIGGSLDGSTAYKVTISVTDSQTVYSAHTTTAGVTVPAQFFPMDFNADASAVGFFMPAPNSGNGVYSGKDIHLFVDANLTTDYDSEITATINIYGWTGLLE